MSRDRYGEFAQANHDIELGRVPPRGNGGNPGATNYDEFFRQTETIEKMVADMKNKIVELEKTYKHSLSSYENEQIHRDSQKIDSLIDDINRLSTSIRDSLKGLDSAARSSNDRMKINRMLLLSEGFRDIIQGYRSTQSTYDRKMRDQIGRQYRIVRPEMTQAEIDQAVAEPSNGIFQQELLKTTRTGRANTVLTEVEDRHRNIQNIVKSVNELSQLFAELNDMVTAQGELINTIEHHTDRVVANVVTANEALDKGVQSALKWRKGKWVCFFITLIILIVIVLIVLWQLGVFKTNTK